MKRTIPALAALLVLAALLIGCGSADNVKDGGPVSTQPGPAPTVAPGGSTSTSEGQATTTSAPGETIQVTAYFTMNEKVAAAHRQVPYTKEVAKAAMEELLKGPNAQEKEVGMFTTVPADTLLLGIAVNDKIATVDLSKEYESGGGSLSMSLRLAQVVYTLTQFPTIDAVQFKLDGKPVDVFGGEGLILDHPVGRADYEELTPAILVESPTVGDTVGSPMRITGTANTFEATFMITITDWDGKIVAEQFATATSGSGTRGTFDVSVPFTWTQYPRGALTVWESSAKDGSHINVVEIPLKFK
ncbi:MAG: GerMN domain-containing protein [Thermoleophilia bacterium]|nr:GerMN domain-containing protein [Thermoleophilia bacterium]